MQSWWHTSWLRHNLLGKCPSIPFHSVCAWAFSHNQNPTQLGGKTFFCELFFKLLILISNVFTRISYCFYLRFPCNDLYMSALFRRAWVTGKLTCLPTCVFSHFFTLCMEHPVSVSENINKHLQTHIPLNRDTLASVCEAAFEGDSMTGRLDEKGRGQEPQLMWFICLFGYGSFFLFIQKQHQPTGAESSRELTVCAMVLA